MQNTYYALLGYAAWTLALLGLRSLIRVSHTFRGARPSEGFSPLGEDISPLAERISRAHANCYESLPIYLAIVSAATIYGRVHVLNSLALVLLATRVGQSTLHLISSDIRVVNIRFILFFIQWLIKAWWIFQLVRF
jgi:uncharacterized MAPEG superfamily protein